MARFKTLTRYLLGIAFIAAGLNHFVMTDFYVSIMPPWLPWHLALVHLSGVAEAGCGLLLVFRRWARWAAWGIIALCVAVFPANLHMALHPELFPQFSEAALWARVPLQVAIMAWAYWYTRGLQGGASWATGMFRSVISTVSPPRTILEAPNPVPGLVHSKSGSRTPAPYTFRTLRRP